jgi:ABC-type multidrug transport system fused ATPase/permease subunit
MIEFALSQLQKYLQKGKGDESLDFKLKYFKEILNKDVEFFDFLKPGDVLKRLNSDFSSIYSFSPLIITENFTRISKIIFSYIYMIRLSWECTILQTILFLSDFYISLENNNQKNKEKILELNREISCLKTEAITNIRIVKSFSTEDNIYNSVREKYILLRNLSNIDSFSSFSNFKTLFHQLIICIQLWILGNKIIQGQFSVGDFTSFQYFSSVIQSSFHMLSQAYFKLVTNLDKCERIFEVINYKQKVRNCENAIKEVVIKGEIKFENVSFSYPLQKEVKILNNFNLSIKSGEVIALVGSSGAGKSTIANLVQRLYDVCEGEVLIDGINIKQYDLKYIHQHMGYVSQEPMLFADSIANNITYGVLNKNSKKEELVKVSQLASAHCFISNKEKFPDGYETLLGNNGLILSGGQKQRIAIARALIKNVRLLIFDEATSALDAASENEVQSAIDKIIKEGGITCIIIAHRLSSI